MFCPTSIGRKSRASANRPSQIISDKKKAIYDLLQGVLNLYKNMLLESASNGTKLLIGQSLGPAIFEEKEMILSNTF